jgi:DUF4097 and DUF4098 domain-containing protein YvlB
VRAHVSTEGDIELTNITASQVVAQNTIGNIFFDGEFSTGGTYEFKSTKGDITIRIPGNSALSTCCRISRETDRARRFLEQWFQDAGRKKICW